MLIVIIVNNVPNSLFDYAVILVLFGVEIHIDLLVRLLVLLIIPLYGILREALMSIKSLQRTADSHR